MKYTVYNQEVEIEDEIVHLFEKTWFPLDDVALHAFVCQGQAKEGSPEEMKKAILTAIKDHFELLQNKDDILAPIKELLP